MIDYATNNPAEFWCGVALIIIVVVGALAAYHISMAIDERKKDPRRLQMK